VNTQATELKNKYEFINLVLPFGFSPFIPEFDDGIDFILHRARDNVHLNIQLKSRWAVDEKYFGRQIWIAFPDAARAGPRNWYLVPHDLMVAHGQKKYSNSKSWLNGSYHRAATSEGWEKDYRDYKVDILLAGFSAELASSVAGCATEWIVSPGQ